MHVQSMTGFGKNEIINDSFDLFIEIKSVNHRFKDVRFKMPSFFLSIEIELREKINKLFKRGSFDVFVNFNKKSVESSIDDLDQEKISYFLKEFKEMLPKEIKLNISPRDIFRQEFFKDNNEDQNKIKELVTENFDDALENLKESRVNEGEKLIKVIKKHQESYLQHFEIIVEKAGEYRLQVETRLLKKIEDYKGELNVDKGRMLQEVIFYLEKLDISEEFNRIKAHMEKFSELLKLGGEIGRQIDFLVQELNRETNTIGSKSGNREISEAVIQMKVELEKIREQGLNLE